MPRYGKMFRVAEVNKYTPLYDSDNAKGKNNGDNVLPVPVT